MHGSSAARAVVAEAGGSGAIGCAPSATPAARSASRVRGGAPPRPPWHRPAGPAAGHDGAGRALAGIRWIS